MPGRPSHAVWDDTGDGDADDEADEDGGAEGDGDACVAHVPPDGGGAEVVGGCLEARLRRLDRGVPPPARDRILECLISHDLVAIEAEAGDLADLGDAERTTIVALSNLRGGADVLEKARTIGGTAVERASSRLLETYEGLQAAGIADRVQLDLGLLRDLDYYSGAILEVYDPALGHTLGGGGRYDELLGRFGKPMPAAGFALYLERAHAAQAAQRRRNGE